ncbi:hypothetical protein [Bacillus sp. 179-C3.3 HS]|uniref:hypothetical protein n=1 Tax=Bacillus sp. 179-C3.3 HS TaxID=3232162 RepID=UPI0039A11F61
MCNTCNGKKVIINTYGENTYMAGFHPCPTCNNTGKRSLQGFIDLVNEKLAEAEALEVKTA